MHWMRKGKMVEVVEFKKDIPRLKTETVYIIQCETGQIKIGKSKNPVKRLNELQTGSPHLLELIYIFKDFPVGTEEVFHNFYSDQLIRNEWFTEDVLEDIWDALFYDDFLKVVYEFDYTKPSYKNSLFSKAEYFFRNSLLSKKHEDTQNGI